MTRDELTEKLTEEVKARYLGMQFIPLPTKDT